MGLLSGFNVTLSESRIIVRTRDFGQIFPRSSHPSGLSWTIAARCRSPALRSNRRRGLSARHEPLGPWRLHGGC
jgi:hypothetical protein